MKEKAKASYLKKGQDVVDMNYKAIDLGATAYKKIDVPTATPIPAFSIMSLSFR